MIATSASPEIPLPNSPPTRADHSSGPVGESFSSRACAYAALADELEGHNVGLGINWDSSNMDVELLAGESFSSGTCAYTGVLIPSSLTCCR